MDSINISSLEFWRSLWVNKDEILIESIVCVSVYPLFNILSDSSDLLFFHIHKNQSLNKYTFQ